MRDDSNSVLDEINETFYLMCDSVMTTLYLTSYTVCQLFGTKQLYSVALVLQKYTYLFTCLKYLPLRLVSLMQMI